MDNSIGKYFIELNDDVLFQEAGMSSKGIRYALVSKDMSSGHFDHNTSMQQPTSRPVFNSKKDVGP